ncbi:MAG: ATP-grasp domain-containing protein [Piscirickettsiaceae bacterium]|nr:ATP-grasp domain-containing protein [Piscirickettsiaceae bacterium]
MMQNQHKSVLIFAQSGRFLAQKASQAGYSVWVADCFGDQDTLSIADRWLEIPPFPNQNHHALLASLSELSQGEDCTLICGSGIETCYALLDNLPDNIQLLGNSAQTIHAIKTPSLFFSLLNQLSLPYPITQFEQPDNNDDWLVKSASGLGGNHIQSLTLNSPITDHYFQKFIEGISGSVLFLADGKDTQLISINKQLHTGDEPSLFRLLSIETPWNITDFHRHQLKQAIREITQATRLLGLNSLDFMISSQDELLILEVNPRPSASAELIDNTASLFQHHCNACLGSLPNEPISLVNNNTSLRYLYADINCIIPDDMKWPTDCYDLPKANTFINKNQPICTTIVNETDKEPALFLHQNIEQIIVQQIAAYRKK